MIDPRFANAGAVPLVPGYGTQQTAAHHHRHHRHHRKHKHGIIGETPITRDESIHKVYQPNAATPFGTGYGVPYGVGGLYPQQKYPGTHYGLGNQYQVSAYDQGQTDAAVVTKHRRRHHRHHRKQVAESTEVPDQSQAVPEVLIGQRSSSVLSNEVLQEREGRSSVSPGAEEGIETQENQRKSRRQQSGEHFSSGRIYHSRQVQGQVSGGAEGYGRINEDLIFIERGENSPHRQKPPPGYDFKGKIEVECLEKEQRSRSRGRTGVIPSQPVAPQVVPNVAPVPAAGPCPPGWQQLVLSAGAGGVPCPTGSSMYTGQAVGTAGVAQPGYGGFGVGGSFGGSVSGGGLANLAACLPFPPQGQLVADYIVESSAGGVASSSGSGHAVNYPQAGGTVEYGGHSEETEEHVTTRAKIIEVWQKRTKSGTRDKTRSRSRSRSHSPTRRRSHSRSRSHSKTHSQTHSQTHSHTHSRQRSPKTTGPSFDFEKFRKEILSAIERVIQPGGTKIINTGGQSGGTQTSIPPAYQGETGKDVPHPVSGGGGEVRVIVQPIQPVFYMPRPSEGVTPGPVLPPIGPGPSIPSVGPVPPPQQVTGGAAQVVYVPRNVYVPVIKPVFVPRERVIVRPQIIHVARPVLVDRPVPVTQRPIIIDRERPIPVPIRGAGQGAAQGGSRVVREEYVYRDNLPVAYGGRCPEYAGGVNYGYMPTQQEHQYASSSIQEGSQGYQAQGPVINVTVPNQYQHSQSAAQLNVQQSGTSFQESYSNAGQVHSASTFEGAPLNCTAPIEVLNTAGNSNWQRSGPIEVLDTTVNSTWQRTDKETLFRRFGRPAADIVQKTDQVEQQMYQELRQRSMSGGVQRSHSAASYGSGSGVAHGGAGGFLTTNASLGSFPVGNIHCD